MSQTKIEWTDKSWNPITGCSPISEGCRNCYAKRMATRLKGRYGYPKDDPFRVTFHPERLDDPVRWKKPSRIFPCSMGDLFYYGKSFHVEEHHVRQSEIFKIMKGNPRHTYLLLTKRPENVAWWTERFIGWWGSIPDNWWLGVSVEDQKTYDERASILSQIECAHRFISFEPLLGLVTTEFLDWRCDWVIVGGETGPGARPLNPDWVRSLRDQCQAAGVPFFFKSWGEWAELQTFYYAPAIGSGNKEYNRALRKYARENKSSVLFPECIINGEFAMGRVGKKKAGRLLDGREWNEFPK